MQMRVTQMELRRSELKNTSKDIDKNSYAKRQISVKNYWDLNGTGKLTLPRSNSLLKPLSLQSVSVNSWWTYRKCMTLLGWYHLELLKISSYFVTSASQRSDGMPVLARVNNPLQMSGTTSPTCWIPFLTCLWDASTDGVSTVVSAVT